MNGNIVAVVLPDLNPVNQLGDHQMFDFLACIAKAVGPTQNLVHLDFVITQRRSLLGLIFL